MQPEQDPDFQDTPRVLGFTNLYPVPGIGDCTFNRQQLNHLARQCPLSLVVPVPFTAALKKMRFRIPYRANPFPVRWGIYWYVPHFLPRLRGTAMTAFLWPAVRRAADRDRPEVFYATWLHPDCWAGLKFAAHLNLPFVAKIHGSDLNQLSQDPRLLPTIKQTLAKADGLVTVSRLLAEKAAAMGADPERISVAPNGVDTALFCPGPKAPAREKLGLPQNAPLVAFVGRLAAVKGWDIALKALAACRGSYHLVFVGDGPEEPAREMAAELGLADRVHFKGSLYHTEIPPFYAACDCLVLASRSEGEPNVVLEALASGRPVATTPVGSAPELVQHGQNGFLAAAIEPAALAKAIDSAMEREWDPAALAASVAHRTWRASAAILRQALLRAKARRSQP